MQIGLDPLVGVDGIHQGLTVTHQLLCRFRIIPQGRVLHTGVEFFQPVRRRFHVEPLAQQIE